WLLLLLFVFAFSAKALHTHHPYPLRHSTASAMPHQNLHDECLLCLFVFSPFTTTNELTVQPNVLFVRSLVFVYSQHEICIEKMHISLRAPPAIS
ncbi:MAG TPA: hypothetical protein VIQ97_04360, partial [Prevotella sp.]